MASATGPSSARPSTPAKNMHRPSPCLRGRDSILVRFTPRKANSDRQRTSQPGSPDPTPQKTSEVFHGPAHPAAAGPAAGEPYEARLVVGHVLDAGAQDLAAVQLGGQ